MCVRSAGARLHVGVACGGMLQRPCGRGNVGRRGGSGGEERRSAVEEEKSASRGDGRPSWRNSSRRKGGPRWRTKNARVEDTVEFVGYGDAMKEKGVKGGWCDSGGEVDEEDAAAEVEESKDFLCFFRLARAMPISLRACLTDAYACDIGI